MWPSSRRWTSERGPPAAIFSDLQITHRVLQRHPVVVGTLGCRYPLRAHHSLGERGWRRCATKAAVGRAEKRLEKCHPNAIRVARGFCTAGLNPLHNFRNRYEELLRMLCTTVAGLWQSDRDGLQRPGFVALCHADFDRTAKTRHWAACCAGPWRTVPNW